MRLGLLERIGMLMRANLRELVSEAEDPEAALRQVMLDIENQLLQVKGQLAVALADQVKLEERAAEHGQKAASRARSRRSRVGAQGRRPGARGAAGRSLSDRRSSKRFLEQAEEQKGVVDMLRRALLELEDKLAEAGANGELMVAERRRKKATRAAPAAPERATPSPTRKSSHSWRNSGREGARANGAARRRPS